MSDAIIMPGAAAREAARGDQILRLGLLVAGLAIGLLPIYRYLGSMIWFR